MRPLLAVPLLALCLGLSACDKQAETTEAPPPPAQAPDFTYETMAGETFTLSEQRGKLVLLDFWATWCKPCIAAMPHLQQIHEDYQQRNVIVMGVNVMEMPEGDPAAFVQEQGFTYQQLLRADEIGEKFGVTRSIPVFIIIGFDGEIIYEQRQGFHPDEVPQIRRVIDEHLAAHGA